MKIKRFRILQEKWIGSYKNQSYRSRDEDIFVNPSVSELQKGRDPGENDGITWVAFPKSKNMYMAKGEAMHEDLSYETVKKHGEDPLRIHGNGSIKNGKFLLYFVEDETLFPSNDGYFMDSYYLGPKFFDCDWKFMDKWIPGFSTRYAGQKEQVIKAKEKYDAGEDED